MKKIFALSIVLILFSSVTFANGEMNCSVPWSGTKNIPLIERKVILNSNNGIATMELEDTFSNTSNFRSEGIYRFSLPKNAFVSGFWINTDEKSWVKGEVKDISVAKEIYHTITHRLVDPGLLEHKDGELVIRVYPVERDKTVGIRFRCFFPARGKGNKFNFDLPLNFLNEIPKNEYDIAKGKAPKAKFRLSATVEDTDKISDLQFLSDSDSQLNTRNNSNRIVASLEGSKMNDISISWQTENKNHYNYAVYQASGLKKHCLLRIDGCSSEAQYKNEKIRIIVDFSGSMGPINKNRAVELVKNFLDTGYAETDVCMLHKGKFQTADFALLESTTPYGPDRWQAIEICNLNGPSVLITDGQSLNANVLKKIFRLNQQKPVWIMVVGSEGVDRNLKASAENYGGAIFLSQKNFLEQSKSKVSEVLKAIANAPALYDEGGSKHLPLFGNLFNRAYYVLPFTEQTYLVKNRAGTELMKIMPESQQQSKEVPAWFVSVIARQQIKTLEAMKQTRDVVKKIAELGIKYSLATDYTAFIAVPDENKDVMNPEYLAMFAAPNYRRARGQARIKTCYANQRVLSGAIEMFIMDHTDLDILEHDLHTGTFNMDYLIKMGYLKSSLNLPTQFCEYRIIGNLEKDFTVVCLAHGTYDRPNTPVEELVEEYCLKNNLNIEDFDIPFDVYGVSPYEDSTGFVSYLRRISFVSFILGLML
jgi:hypothetical protein